VNTISTSFNTILQDKRPKSLSEKTAFCIVLQKKVMNHSQATF